MVWTPISRRTQVELEGTVGLYTNLIAVAERVRGGLTASEFLALIERKVLRAHANGDVSALTAVMKNPAVRPTLPVIGLNFFSFADGAAWELAGTRVTDIEIPADDVALLTALEVAVHGSPASMTITVNYDTAIFDAEGARQILNSLMVATDGLLGNPSSRVADLLLSGKGVTKTAPSLVDLERAVKERYGYGVRKRTA
jgi:hypothetical protein